MTPAKTSLPLPAIGSEWALVGFFRRLAASLMALVSTMAFAGLDRGGNVIHEDDGGGYGNMGLGDIGALFAVWVVAGYFIVRILGSRTNFSQDLIYNIAFFGGAILAVLAVIT